MVGVLAGVVAVLAVITVLNLVLLFAVIRRLRAAEAHGPGGRMATLPAAGAEVGAFLAATVDDSAVSDTDVRDDAVVAFVMTGCEPCKGQIAAFQEQPRAAAERTVFFVVGDPADPATGALVASLDGLGRIAYAALGDPVATAFGKVDSFPTLFRTAGGKVAAVGRTWDEIGVPALAPPATAGAAIAGAAAR